MDWICSDKLATPLTRPPGSESATIPDTSAPLAAITTPWRTIGALRLAWKGSPVFTVLVDMPIIVRTLMLLPAGRRKVFGLGGGGGGGAAPPQVTWLESWPPAFTQWSGPSPE